MSKNITATQKSEFKGKDKVTAKCKTPVGVASFPHLNQPDEFMNSLQYKVDLRLDPSDPETATFITEVESWENKHKDTQRANLKSDIASCKGARDADKKSKLEGMLADVDSDKYKGLLTTEYDRDSGEPTGKLTMRAKCNASGKSNGEEYKIEPKLYDATGRLPLATAPIITAGSKLRLNLLLSTYEMPSSGYVGVSIRLMDVLIVELGASTGGSDSNPFGNDKAHQPDTFDATQGLEDTEEEGY